MKKPPICLCGNLDGHKGNVYHPAPGEPVDPKRVLDQSAKVKIKPRMVEFGAVVVRCGCDPVTFDAQGRAVHTLQGRPCPTPRQVEDRGILAAYYRNPIRRLRYWLRRRGKVTIANHA